MSQATAAGARMCQGTFFVPRVMRKRAEKWSDQNRSLKKLFFCAKNKWYFRYEIYGLYRLNKRNVNFFGSLCTLLNGKMVL
jgi:hypothetical protein